MGKKILAAWICLGLLFIVAGYLFTYQEEIRLNLNRIAHTQEILSHIYDLQNNLTDAEAGAQAFLASGDGVHLTFYTAALGEITRDLEELQQLAAGEVEQERLLQALQRAVGKRLDLLEQAIARRRDQSAEENEQPELSKEGKRLQASIRKQLDKIEEMEKKLLDPQWARNKKKRDLYLSLLTLGTFLSYSLLLIVFYLLNRENQQRKHVEQSLARYQANLRSLASQLSLTEERERRRLALYLHDQIGHTLALTNIRVGELQEATAAAPGSAPPAKLQEIRALLEQAIRDTQSLTFNISPPILYELGLASALEWLTEQFAAQNGIQARFETDHRHRQINQDLEILLFQAVNELLFNALKHARPQHVNVSLWSDDDLLKVGVDDDGQGFSPPNGTGRSQGGGFGLFSIRERLIPYNGSLNIKSKPDEGTLITIAIPIPPSITNEN